MPRPGAQPVTFYIPEVYITVSVDDVRRLVDELRRYARDELREGRLRAAERLERALAGARGTQRLIVSDLLDDEQQALLRAVEQLRWSDGGISRELGRLHNALTAWVPLPHFTYDVVRGYAGETLRFVSYTGRYAIGDRLPRTKPEECWEVVDVQPPHEDQEHERLVVEPCREDS